MIIYPQPAWAGGKATQMTHTPDLTQLTEPTPRFSDHFTVAEAAATLGVSSRTVRRYISLGALASVTSYGRRLLPVTAVENLRGRIGARGLDR